ncbi:MAG: hypothetical protein V2I67_05905 [Thermoanaerobaculales bacterium]|jgi:hypothetical protein|nr:hypothetical protein [Thermoanaerobaculales bacterium]
MKIRCLVFGLVLIAICSMAAAEDLTWVNAADTNEWYRFSRVPDTQDPFVWVNNWGQVHYQYPGDPAPTGMRTPVWEDTANINIDGADLRSSSADVSEVEVGLGGALLLRNTLRCITLNTAGLVTMGRDGEVFQCAIQDNGGTGILRSVKGAHFTVADPLLNDVIISVPVEIPDTMALGLLGDIQLNNTIDILANSEASVLVIDGDVSLSGSGWVETNTSTENEICAHYNSGQRFTNQVTIHAAGRIGCNEIAITNEALIVADRTGMLTVDPTGAPNDGLSQFRNTGTLRATGGATLRLDRGAFDNTGGVIEAEDASVVELHDIATVSGGTLQTVGTGEIRPSGNGSVIRDLTLGGGGAIVIPDGRKLEAEGTITIDGQMRLESTGTEATLIVRSPVSLVGTGEVVLSDSTKNRFSHDGIDGGYRLTSAIPIRGATGEPHGLANGIGLTNQSTITADGTELFLINPHNSPIDGQAGVINTGTLRATGGATLRLAGGSFDNAGGMIEAQDASVVELFEYADVTGGTLETAGSGEIRPLSAGNVIRDLTLAGGSVLVIPDGQKLRADGTITVNGELRLESTGTEATLIVRSPVSLVGTGEVVLSDFTGNRFSHDGVDGGYRLTSAIPIRGATGEPHGLANGIALTNQSTITADGTEFLLINPHDSPIDGQPGVINTGTLRAVSGATMRLQGGSFDNTGGIVEAQDLSTIELHDGISLTGGVVQSIAGGVVRSTTGFSPPSLSNLTVEGRLEALGGTDLRLGGTIVNNGVIEVEDHVLPSGDLVFGGTGELRLVDGAQIRPDGDSVTNGADHTIRASGAAQNRIHHPLDHDGALVVETGATLRIDEACDAGVGSSSQIDGTFLPVGGLAVSGELSGVGSVSGTVDLMGAGVLSPGSSAGTLTISNLNIEDGATYRWQTSVNRGSDLVDVAGTLDMTTATLTVDISPTAGNAPGRVVLFAYDSLATTPDISQFVLTGGYEFTGIDISGNELALTGVTNPNLLFADDLETGDTDRWDVVQGSLLKSLFFEPATDELNVQMSLPSRVVESVEETTLAGGYDVRNESVFLVVAGRAGALRVGVRCADGWRWSDWQAPVGSKVELHWRPEGIWLYDGRGLVGSAAGTGNDTQLTRVQALSTGRVKVRPTAVAGR